MLCLFGGILIIHTASYLKPLISQLIWELIFDWNLTYLILSICYEANALLNLSCSNLYCSVSTFSQFVRVLKKGKNRCFGSSLDGNLKKMLMVEMGQQEMNKSSSKKNPLFIVVIMCLMYNFYTTKRFSFHILLHFLLLFPFITIYILKIFLSII